MRLSYAEMRAIQERRDKYALFLKQKARTPSTYELMEKELQSMKFILNDNRISDLMVLDRRDYRALVRMTKGIEVPDGCTIIRTKDLNHLENLNRQLSKPDQVDEQIETIKKYMSKLEEASEPNRTQSDNKS